LHRRDYSQGRKARDVGWIQMLRVLDAPVQILFGRRAL
jgi:hypothetical protein